jgi:hypothetical protein
MSQYTYDSLIEHCVLWLRRAVCVCVRLCVQSRCA